MTDTKTDPQAQEGTGWRPSEGDILKGRITAVGKAWSDWTNSFYPLITVRDEVENRDVDVHCFHHTLKGAMMENRPVVGDPIEIAYLGKRKTKDGKREAVIYRVTLPNATGENVWADLTDQDRRAPRAAAQGTLADNLDDRYGETLPE